MRQLSQRHRARSAQGDARPFAGMRPVTPHAAGVARGAHAIVACVPDGEDPQIVRTCGPSTAARQMRADGCVARGLQTVAMASTGVYWMPLCEELAARGLPCGLLSAPSLTRVPGRQSDVVDWQGSQPLQSSG
jgi:transposase